MPIYYRTECRNARLAPRQALRIHVFLGGSEPEIYAANMISYKRWLAVVTITYFVGALIWQTRRERARGEG